MSRPRVLAVGFFVLALGVPAPVVGAPPDGPPPPVQQREPRRDPATGTAPTALVVRYRDGADEAARGSIRAAERLDRIRTVRGTGLEVVRPRGRSLEAAMAALQRRPDVDAVSVDHRRTTEADPTGEPYWGYMWGHHNQGQALPEGHVGVADVDVDGREALAITPGSSNVVVAVIDDGVDFGHPDLAARAWVNPGESGTASNGADRRTNGVDDDANGYVDDIHGWDFCNDDNTVHDFDEDAHGTGVAGTIAASLDGAWTVGMAPASRIMGLKFLVESNPDCSTDSLAIEAIAYARSFGVRIINASWGGDGYNSLLEAAIESSGALFVAAAGNEGRNIDSAPVYPAAFDSPNLLSVASIGPRGGLSVFSNRGTTAVDIGAPGEFILAPCPADSDYAVGVCGWDGTSFAAPYAAGVAALVGAVNPAILASPTTMRARLIGSGVPLASLKGHTASGKLLNARRALDFKAPVLTATPRLTPRASTTLGASSISARLSWAAATDDFGIGSYRVEQRRNGGAWSYVGVTSALYRDVVVALSGTYEFRVQPRDQAGNAGAWSPIGKVLPARAEEGGAGVAYTGTWRSSPNSAASGGATRYTTGTNASVTYTFTGRSVAVVLPLSNVRSSVKLYIDGKYIRTLSLYSSTSKNRQVVVAQDWAASGSHAVRLINTPVSGRSRADIDAFVVFR